jgi:aminoglycoside 6-adenylyltransferase
VEDTKTAPTQLPTHHQAVVERFTAACAEDVRIVAAFLGGSYARGAADDYSDLDLGLITTDAAYEDFAAGRDTFIRRLGEPVFLEAFDLPNVVFFILRDGAEVELAYGREGQFHSIHSGPFTILLDKTGILTGVVFSGPGPGPGDPVETRRRMVYGFWHDLSHFITAMGRGQRWWAMGQLEQLRLQCVNLARLRHDAADGAEGYEKLETSVPASLLAPLQATFGPLEAESMLRAARLIVRYFQELARPLAQAHGFPYPAELERIMVGRLEKL